MKSEQLQQRRNFLAPFLLAAMVGLCAAVPSRAQAAVAGPGMHREMHALPATQAPTLDGRLDDEVWQQASADSQFTQNFPEDGAEPSFRTEIRVAFDSDYLYVAVRAYDSDPSQISARVARRDSVIPSDYVEIYLDSRHTHENGYYFRVNAAGVLSDGEIHDDVRINRDWDAVWNAKTQVDASGWTAEMQLPISILRFQKSATKNTVFGFNLFRGIRRTGEIVQWVHIPRTAAGNLSRAGHLLLPGLKPRRTVELRPFILGRTTNFLQTGGSFFTTNADNNLAASIGLDGKLGLTGGLTLDGTIRPDFGQVEADPIVLNLTTFENFFPEKRPFFLEGAGLWTLDLRLIHSRRIGERTSLKQVGQQVRLDSGEYVELEQADLFVPIHGALRVTGTIGKWFALNALSAVTAPEVVVARQGDQLVDLELAPEKLYTVARGKYSFGGSTYQGFALTGVTRLGQSIVPEANHDAYVQSLDGRWVRSDGMYRLYYQAAVSSRHGGDRYAEGDVHCQSGEACRPFVRPDGTIQGPGDVGYAGEVGGSKAGGTIQTYARYRFISPLFDVDDAGFENDWDFHQFFSNTSYNRERAFGWFERGQLLLAGRTEIAFDGTRKGLVLSTKASGLTRGFWNLSLTGNYFPPKSFTTRETSDGAFFESNDLASVEAEARSDERGDYSAALGLVGARSLANEFRSISARLSGSARPTSRLLLTADTSLRFSKDNLRVIDCETADGSCWRRSAVRDYTLALQDARSLDLIIRTSFALSTQVSFDGYVQLFAAASSLHGGKVITNVQGSAPKLRRSALMPGPEVSSSFSFANLVSNLVLRWEFTPGSTLTAVYSRSQAHNRQRERLAFSGLRYAAGQEVALLKLTIFKGL